MSLAPRPAFWLPALSLPPVESSFKRPDSLDQIEYGSSLLSRADWRTLFLEDTLTVRVLLSSLSLGTSVHAACFFSREADTGMAMV